MNYLVDAYTIFAASVLAGSGIIRSLFGAAFPLFTVQMYQNIGIHWASMVPAFLATACAIFPFLLYKYGATIRQKCKYAAEADAFMQQMRNRAMAVQSGRSNPQSAGGSQAELVNAQNEIPLAELEDNTEPRFAELKTEQETQNGLEKVNTSKTTRSMRSTRTVNAAEYDVNPYEIDRVNTRESFGAGMRRADSRASTRVKRTLTGGSSRR